MAKLTSSNPIRVAHVLTSLSEGGLERFTLTLATKLPKERFDIRIYTLLRDNPWIAEFESNGIPVTVLDGNNRPGVRGTFMNLSALFRLARAFRRDGIRIVHTPDFYPAFMGRSASLIAGVPSRVHTLHSVYDWFPWFVHPLQRVLGRFTDVVTGVSRQAIEFSRRHDKLPASKYRLVHNGADETRFRPDPAMRRLTRRQYGWRDDDLVVGTVGARTPRKGHPLLAEAMIPLMRNDPRLRLAVVGAISSRYPDTRPRIEAMLAESGLSDRCHFLSPRSDIENVYSAFDIHCMPSEVEGLSFASIEGMMSGCVSVFSDLPAFREVSDAERTGFLFEQGNVVQLRQALVRAAAVPWSDPVLPKRAREHAIERFGQTRMLREYASIYADLDRSTARGNAVA
jgi:glycosyltransferase involved in cell wall biosynthesis